MHIPLRALGLSLPVPQTGSVLTLPSGRLQLLVTQSLPAWWWWVSCGPDPASVLDWPQYLGAGVKSSQESCTLPSSW